MPITVNVTTVLDVLPKFNSLMQEALSGDSVYIRTKETLTELFNDYNMTATEKASLISNVLGSLSSSITSQAMATALQWATQEKELAFSKLALEYDLESKAKDNELKDQQIEDAYWLNIARQAEMRRIHGVPSIVDGTVVALSDSGKIWTDMQLTEQNTLNAVKEGVILDAKAQESYAAIHRAVADTVTNFGSFVYDGLGASGITGLVTRTSVAGVQPLADTQRVIAKEQAKGYAWNAWANAVTASAGMIGTAVASDGAISSISTLVAHVSEGINNLKNINEPAV